MAGYKSKSDFNVIRTLGRGGFGAALLARHRGDFVELVLKEVNLTAINDAHDASNARIAQKVVEMSRKEHETITKFNHPCIIRVFGWFEEKHESAEFYYLVMEYCAGGDLASFIANATLPLPEAQFQTWSRQLVSAVKFLHDAGHVHRDIKPGNIFLTGDQQSIKLGDFGLAKGVDIISQNTDSATMVASWPYASPEFCSGKPYKEACDVWALGVTLFELANFKRPFDGPGIAGLITAILRGQPTSFAMDRGYSTELRDFVMAMLETNFVTRPTIGQIFENRFLQMETQLARNANSSNSDSSIQSRTIVPQNVADNDITNRPASSPSTTKPVSSKVEFPKIQQSPTIPEHLKAPICTVLQGEFLTEDQLLAYDDAEIKSIFPQRGLQTAILTWKHQQEEQKESELKAEELERQVLPYADRMHEAAIDGNLTAIKSILVEVRSKHSVKLLVEHKNFADFNRTPLLESSMNGHVTVVEFLVQQCDADVYARDSGNLKSMAIHLASELGHLTVVNFFLKERPDLLEAKNKNSDTPLCRASSCGHLEIVEYLIGVKGANVEARGFNGRTPLHSAAEKGHLDVARYLAEKAGADVCAKDSDLEAMPIHLAAQFCHRDIVDYFLSMNKPNLLEAKDKHDNTPLCKAAFGGHLDVVEYLIGVKRANVEARGQIGRTPLHNAAERCRLHVVRYLIEEAGADIYAKDAELEALPVHLAARDGHTEIVDYLLNRRPDLLEAKNKNGLTPLGYAKFGNKTDVVKLLEARGARS